MSQITITDFQKGIGSSSQTGFQDMKCVDVFNVNKVARAEFKTYRYSNNKVTTTVTNVNTTTDVLTVADNLNNGNPNSTINGMQGRPVTFTSTGTLPGGITAGTVYFVITVTQTTLKIATTLANANAGTAVDITTTGTGTITLTSVDMGEPKFVAYDMNGGPFQLNTQAPIGVTYVVDSNGRVWYCDNIGGVWYLLSGNTLTNASGNGLAVWKNYLIVFRNQEIDTYGPLNSGSPAWRTLSATSAAYKCNQATTATYDHVAFVNSADTLYFGDRNSTTAESWLGYIQELTTFDPASAPTFTFSNQVVRIPRGNFVTVIEELFPNLAIGTTGQAIYFWDTFSANLNSSLPISERNVTAMRNINNALYYSAGVRANIYRTLGTSSSQVLDFSDQLADIPRSIAIITDIDYFQSRLVFSLYHIPGASTTEAISGVYSVNLDEGLQKGAQGEYILKNVLSPGYGSFSDPLKTTFIFCSFNNSNLNFFIGWKNNNDSGIDGVYNFFRRYNNWEAEMESPMYEIGTSLQKATMEKFQFNLLQKLTVGQGVRFSFRTENDGAYSTPVEFTFGVDGPIMEGHANINIQNAQFIQAKIAMTCSTGSGNDNEFNTPLLKSLVLQIGDRKN